MHLQVLINQAAIAAQVGQLLQPDLFDRPSAVLAVALAGSDIGTALKHGSKPSTVLDLSCNAVGADFQYAQATAQVTGGSDSSQASQVLSAVASLDLTDDSLVRRVPLDYTSLQGCGSACLEESLKVASASHAAKS